MRCPLKAGIPLEHQAMGYAECDMSDCQLWDEGLYDKFEPGCGLVPRENRKC
jgi:hypothetical protein